MHRFEYRLPRTATTFGVDFLTGNETFHGLCRDVSEAGIRAEFDGALAVNAVGTLVLRHPTGVLRVEAHVAHIEDLGQVGLSFVFHAAHERGTILRLIASLADGPRRLPIARS